MPPRYLVSGLMLAVAMCVVLLYIKLVCWLADSYIVIDHSTISIQMVHEVKHHQYHVSLIIINKILTVS